MSNRLLQQATFIFQLEKKKAKKTQKKVDLQIVENQQISQVLLDLIQQKNQTGYCTTQQEAVDVIIKILIQILKMSIRQIRITPTIVSLVSTNNFEKIQPIFLYTPDNVQKSHEEQVAFAYYKKYQKIFEEINNESSAQNDLESLYIQNMKIIWKALQSTSTQNNNPYQLFENIKKQELQLKELIMSLKQLNTNQKTQKKLSTLYSEYQKFIDSQIKNTQKEEKNKNNEAVNISTQDRNEEAESKRTNENTQVLHQEQND